jgi:hypothetical protein
MDVHTECLVPQDLRLTGKIVFCELALVDGTYELPKNGAPEIPRNEIGFSDLVRTRLLPGGQD